MNRLWRELTVRDVAPRFGELRWVPRWTDWQSVLHQLSIILILFWRDSYKHDAQASVLKPRTHSLARRACIWLRPQAALRRVSLKLAACFLIGWAATSIAQDGPLSPAASLAEFKLLPGIRIELAACEPEVVDPVAVRFDEDGRMWVVEMRDYPLGPVDGETPRSRIRMLEDRDGDGHYEHAVTFADGLLFATGIQPWQGGVIVTLAGRVAYLKDTTGDGRADFVENLYTGFAQENSQLRANHPRLALDNHVYIANGLRGGTIVDARKPASPPVSISGMDFRFDPLNGRFEAVSGVGQFGLALDDAGNRFVCSNRNPVQHIVLEDWYLKRNPRVAVPAVSHDVARAGAESRLFPISRAWTTSNLHAGQFTAACGVQIYGGDALPELYGNAFTCDPTGNLVHREIVRNAGATFESLAAREGVEFLASRDEWFRPVNLEVGPDGALYVVDMYRAVIEHPQFMPDELKERPDLLLGNDRGRIYRIVPKNATRATDAAPPLLSKASAAELVKLLEHRNVWQRETAARLLLERQDQSVESALTQLATNGREAVPRIHALWLLRGLGLLKPEHLALVRDDDDPRLIEHALKLADEVLSPDEYVAMLKRTAHAPHARVRFQTALGLARLANDENVRVAYGEALTTLFGKPVDDPWLRSALAIAAGDRPASALAKYLASNIDWHEPASEQLALVGDLARMIDIRKESDQAELALRAIVQLPADARRTQTIALTGFSAALTKVRTTLDAYLTNTAHDEKVSTGVTELLTKSQTIAGDSQQPAVARIEAIALLAETNLITTLQSLALDEPDSAVRLAAIDALARQSGLEPWPELLRRFSAESPATRRAIVSGALAQSPRTELLLDALEAGQIKPSELDVSVTARLTGSRDVAVRERATKILAAAIPADRQQVLAEYQTALSLRGDSLRGREVFRTNCATCHRVGEVGVNVAPDISDSRTKTAAQILTDILQPNRAIDSNYVSYTVVAADGRVLTGLLVSETATSITLRQPEDKSVTLLRTEIDELRSNAVSLMPEGLEKNVPPQAMADLISFIKNWRYLDGRTPLSP